ncbi:MAG: methyltransferase domain-containing protein [Chloroflexi bacterium]|nr:methyltransferase domain-containing protein [Chloroflexota bacterium]
MTAQAFDSRQYKERQLQEWNAVAAAWRKWWEVIEAGAQHVSDRLVELAEVQPGQRVLDVATGIGEPAVSAARRVGPSGHVTATDHSPQMLEIARERAAALGLQNIEFKEMDAERLEVPEGSFDAALCRWGLMFLPDLPAALDRIGRSLSPGGRMAAAVWSVPPKTPLVSLAMGVIQKMFQPPPPPAGAPGPFALADTSILEKGLADAGFTDIRIERMMVTIEFPSAEGYTDFIRDIAPPVRAMLATQPEGKQAEAWRAIADAAAQFAGADGVVRLPSETILVAARR